MDPAANAPTERPSCSLTTDERDGRLAEWRTLIAEAHERRVEADRIFSRYPDRPDVRERLSALIAAEGECCSFLTFEVSQGDGHVDVELRFPPSFAPTVAGLDGA